MAIAMDVCKIDDERTNYDFEGQVWATLPPLIEAAPQPSTGLRGTGDQMKFRTQVCSYWLIGLCQKGADCGHLHKLEKGRCPQCPNGEKCRLINCLNQHLDEEDKQECLFYKQGFCMNGPICKFKHLMKTPEECPVKASFNETVVSMRAGTDRSGAKMWSQGKSTALSRDHSYYRITLCSRWLECGHNGAGPCQFVQECNFAHGEGELRTMHDGPAPGDDVFDPTRGKMSEHFILPFDTTTNLGYVLLQSPDLRSLAISKMRSIWAVPTTVANEINKLFTAKNVEKVIVYFCVQDLFGIYGVGVINAPIPASPPMVPISPEFPVEWLRTIRCQLRVVSHLKTPDGRSVQSLYDDVILDRATGTGIALVIFRKPLWEWFLQLEKAQPNNILLKELGPEMLFSMDWIERAISVCSESGMLGGMDASIEQEFYNGESTGFIFGIPAFQIDECFGRGLFGGSTQVRKLFEENIQMGSPLFLLDITNNMLFGLFQASSLPTENLDPNAFMKKRGGSALECVFPIQVAVMCVLEGAPVPESDPEIRKIFGGKSVKPGPLSMKETKQLCNFFAIRCGAMGGGGMGMGMGMAMGPLAGLPPPPIHAAAAMMGVAGPGGMPNVQGPTGPNVYKPPFKFSDAVYVNAPFVGDGYQLRKMLLGHQASKIMQIVQECGGSNANLRIRIRGIGSGFKEGKEQIEMQEPMHFVVSAENPALLEAAMIRVDQHCASVRP